MGVHRPLVADALVREGRHLIWRSYEGADPSRAGSSPSCGSSALPRITRQYSSKFDVTSTLASCMYRWACTSLNDTAGGRAHLTPTTPAAATIPPRGSLGGRHRSRRRTPFVLRSNLRQFFRQWAHGRGARAARISRCTPSRAGGAAGGAGAAGARWIAGAARAVGRTAFHEASVRAKTLRNFATKSATGAVRYFRPVEMFENPLPPRPRDTLPPSSDAAPCLMSE